jgi:hypothetical protein
MSKLPEGRKALPDEWFVDRANNWGQIRPMTDEERNRAKEKEKANMNADEIDAVSLIAQMKRLNLTVTEALEAMQIFANDKQFQKDLDATYSNMVLDDWDYWHEGDIE